MSRSRAPTPLWPQGWTLNTLEASDLYLDYDQVKVIQGLSLKIPPGKITAIVGANGCGKSTLLKALARILTPSGGLVYLDGEDINGIPTRLVATKVGLLPQSPIAPDSLVVEDLVAMGRYPHQGWLRQWTAEDREAVESALVATRMVELADRPVDSLSGGQRQKAWIAMTLAQQSEILLLDEPTTFLDMAHQCEVLDLLVELNTNAGRTVVMVLHDVNQACRYSHYLVAMSRGVIIAAGRPSVVVTPEMILKVFGLACVVVPDPVAGTPMCVPASAPALAVGFGM